MTTFAQQKTWSMRGNGESNLLMNYITNNITICISSKTNEWLLWHHSILSNLSSSCCIWEPHVPLNLTWVLKYQYYFENKTIRDLELYSKSEAYTSPMQWTLLKTWTCVENDFLKDVIGNSINGKNKLEVFVLTKGGQNFLRFISFSKIIFLLLCIF